MRFCQMLQGKQTRPEQGGVLAFYGKTDAAARYSGRVVLTVVSVAQRNSVLSMQGSIG